MALVLYAFFIYVILSSSMQAYYDENGDMNERPVLQARAAEITDSIYGSCDSTVYYENTSPFTTNLRTVLSVVNDTSSSMYSGRYSLPYPTNTSQSAYATYECRRDLSIQECHACVQKTLTYYCTYNGAYRADLVISAMTIMLRGCYFRYSNREGYLQALAGDVRTTNHESCDTAPASAMQAGVSPALAYLRTIAPYQTAGFFASVAVVDVKNFYPPVYALAQCLSFLSSAECAQCLDRMPDTNCTARLSTYSDLEFYLPVCFYTFNTSMTVAFNSKYTTTLRIDYSMLSPPPPKHPPPPPPRSPPPPPPLSSGSSVPSPTSGNSL